MSCDCEARVARLESQIEELRNYLRVAIAVSGHELRHHSHVDRFVGGFNIGSVTIHDAEGGPVVQELPWLLESST